MGFELKFFTAKTKRGTKGSWHRLRVGSLVIECRRIPAAPDVYKVKTPPECSLDGALIAMVLERRITIEKVGG